MELKDIVVVFEKYGWVGGTFIVLLFILMFTIKSSWFTTLWSKISDKVVEKFMKNKTKDIKKKRDQEWHIFFKIPACFYCLISVLKFIHQEIFFNRSIAASRVVSFFAKQKRTS